MEKRKTFHGRQVGKKRFFLHCFHEPQHLLKSRFFPLFLFLLIPLNGYGDDTPMPEVVQQNSTRITGVVKDAYGEPVIGANVKVVGTTQGTITDFEGKFSINVSGASAKIKISFIGYKDKEVTAKKGVSLNIVLEEDAQTLGEVQVVAYGVQKKVSITGAISSMKGDDLLKTPAGSLSNVLSGQITGISSVQYSGEPGADAADIYVRGVATWNNAKPLIQVDGVERDFSQIDPNEIESVTVLKDASATAVFGVRGANGVILITTKRGAEPEKHTHHLRRAGNFPHAETHIHPAVPPESPLPIPQKTAFPFPYAPAELRFFRRNFCEKSRKQPTEVQNHFSAPQRTAQFSQSIPFSSNRKWQESPAPSPFFSIPQEFFSPNRSCYTPVLTVGF